MNPRYNVGDVVKYIRADEDDERHSECITIATLSGYEWDKRYYVPYEKGAAYEQIPHYKALHADGRVCTIRDDEVELVVAYEE